VGVGSVPTLALPARRASPLPSPLLSLRPVQSSPIRHSPQAAVSDPPAVTPCMHVILCTVKLPSGCPPHARQPCQTASAAQTHGRRHSGRLGLRPAISGRTGLVLTLMDASPREAQPLYYLAGLKRRQSLLAICFAG
jgi:hypothetical protein